MKIFYNSKVAKIMTFMPGFKTIMLFGAVFTEKSSLSLKTKLHEAAHVVQYQTLFCAGLASAVITMFVMFAFGVRSWWMLSLLAFPPLAYYIWYGIEFLIRLAATRSADKAYYAISFEKEAYELQEEYLEECENRDHAYSFSFLHYL